MKLTLTHLRTIPSALKPMESPTPQPRRLCVALAHVYGRCRPELVTIAHRFGTLRRQRPEEPRQ